MHKTDLTTIINLRKELHTNPELSGFEFETTKRIRQFLIQNQPTEIIENLGGTGLAAVYQFSNTGKTIVIRCELDALPIQEVNDFEHQSKTQGVSHKCGHDGHMAIVSGLGFWLKEQKFNSGKVVLLFQPAEENGEGAHKIVTDEKFKNLKPDYVFALHNIPKEPMHSIITIQKGFSAEVQSFIIKVKGKESHAAEPENGINPALAISEIIAEIANLEVVNTEDENFTIMTPVHVSMGQKSYGISPADGELHYTLRAWDNPKMEAVKSKIVNAVATISSKFQLEHTIEWIEYFPASINDKECNDYVIKAAAENSYKLIQKPHPFKFGEDFGWYAKEYKTAMFGLGAGIETPALHNADYDFPDELIETGITMFQNITGAILNKNS
ncbi:amidohydrolase [Flavobacterium macacae]|uniref:Amidohydrolase n=1 Tax=Flavobacterium macacae TaxID=2488993 RepID=A0A3P3WAH2_9FLAO|nr:amidohydrolase [Flavobacterium macacae]RRJ91357.1 amidohydrolase [Flavobacterium macacae]